MKPTVTVVTDRHTDIPWPDDMALPAPGDEVNMYHAGEVISFQVDHRVFDLGDTSRIRIYGHHATPGSV
jgi:hypothetical protein